MLIITKPIQLQGAGAASTIINPVQSPTDKIANWRVKVNELANCTHQLGLITGQPNNTANPTAPCGFTPGTGLFSGDEGPGILVAPVAGAFNGSHARIDGFTITGADQSAGIFVNGNARFLEISNNVIANNQGAAAAGIRVGYPTLIDAADPVATPGGTMSTGLANAENNSVDIHHNHVTQNGGTVDPGAGIGLYNGSNNYRVTNNYIAGNFALGDGAGIAHYGYSPGGLIADNKILFNQTFDQTANVGGNGGGILIAGHEPMVGNAVPLSEGSGSVQILRNIIQGNNAGSGEGAGIALRFVNGTEVETVGIGNNSTSPATIRAGFSAVQIVNNMIVNNVTGLAGGGISIQDAINVAIVNNTIANNDSTATASAALNASNNASAPQPAGIVAHAHSAALLAAAAARIAGNNDRMQQAVGTYSNPTLQNDIILGNRSMVWSQSGSFPSTGQLYGGVSDATGQRFWDLAVVGVSGALAPRSSILTLANETRNGQPGCGVNGNFCKSGELAAELTVLQCPYRHGETTPGTCAEAAVINGATHVPGGEFPILAAAALDEGGNFIDVHFGPLTARGSNYHLQTCTAGPGPGPSGTAPVVASAPVYTSSGNVGDLLFSPASFPWPVTHTGDRVVAVVLSDGNPTILGVGDLSGHTFTSRGNVNQSGAVKAEVFEYDVTGTPPTGNMGVLLLLALERVQVRMFVISGHDPAQPLQVATNSGTSTTMVYPSLTVPSGGAPTLWIQAAAFDGGNGHAFSNATNPAGYTNLFDVQSSSQGIGATSGYSTGTAATETPSSVSFNGGSDQWVSVTIGVRAAAGGGGGGGGGAAGCAIDAGTVPTVMLTSLSPDVDREARPYGSNFDIGADELAIGSINTSLVANSNVAPVIYSPTNNASISAFVGAPLTFTVEASDANGDALAYGICQGNANCTPGPSLPSGITISPTTGSVTWATPTLGTQSNLRVKVSDGTATTTATFSIATTNAVTLNAVTDAYTVNVNGTFSVGGSGVLGNDTPSNAAKTAGLNTNVDPSQGSVALNPNGSFSFMPSLTFVGSTTFQYVAINAAGVSSAPGIVTLTKRVAVTDASYLAGKWQIQGVLPETNPGQALVFRRVRGNSSSVINGTLVRDGANWTFTSANNSPSWQPGDTIAIYATSNTQTLLLGAVAVTSLDPRTAPNSTSYVQCPGDTNGDGVIDNPDPTRHVVCKHLAAGDGFIRMADGKELYSFGFNDVTGVAANLAVDKGILNAQFPAPTLAFDEGDDVYLTLTNVGMLKRPDLFDPHTVHFHGFPNAAAVFDGVPEASIAINMGFSFTYYYKIMEPGTYMYHCHVEAAEHMQMGMFGNLYVRPAQNALRQV